MRLLDRLFGLERVEKVVLRWRRSWTLNRFHRREAIVKEGCRSLNLPFALVRHRCQTWELSSLNPEVDSNLSLLMPLPQSPHKLQLNRQQPKTSPTVPSFHQPSPYYPQLKSNEDHSMIHLLSILPSPPRYLCRLIHALPKHIEQVGRTP